MNTNSNSNSNTNPSRETLARATACELPADVKLTAEETDLREAWLAFGQLLSAQDQEFDAKRILAGLAAEAQDQDDTRPAPAQRGELPVGPTRRIWWFALSAAAALALLAGVAWWNQSRMVERGGPVASDTVNDDSPSEAPGLAPSVAPRQAAPEVAADSTSEKDSATAWDDSFDERIAATQQRLWELRTGSAVSEVRYESLRQAVDSFDSDLSSSSL